MLEGLISLAFGLSVGYVMKEFILERNDLFNEIE